jgi:hypothetical protein
MTARGQPKARPRPTLPKIPEEMRQWCDLLLEELLRWPNVRSRPMFGMIAVYRGSAIFGAVPRTRAMDNRYGVSFKLPQRTPRLLEQLRRDPHILLPDKDSENWISFELQSGEDISAALRWFDQAYRLVEQKSV